MSSYGQSQIVQKPKFTYLVAGQPIIFALENNQVVANEIRVKHSARLFVSATDIVSTQTQFKIGDFKTTPNNTGIGIFDFRDVLESFVSADNMAWTDDAKGSVNGPNSKYKGNIIHAYKPVPMHLIDAISRNSNSCITFKIQFRTEWYDSGTNSIVFSGTTVNSEIYTLYNGYVKYDDVMEIGGGLWGADIGYDLRDRFRLTSDGKEFMTNAPGVQYAGLNDYMTMAAMLLEDASPNNNSGVSGVQFDAYNSSGSLVFQDDIIFSFSPDGGYSNTLSTTQYSKAYNRMLFFGCGPANIQTQFSINFTSLGVDYYTIRATGV